MTGPLAIPQTMKEAVKIHGTVYHIVGGTTTSAEWMAAWWKCATGLASPQIPSQVRGYRRANLRGTDPNVASGLGSGHWGHHWSR